MKLGLINSAWVQAGRETSYGIRKTREIGFDSINMFADPLDISDQERALIRRECAAAALGLEIALELEPFQLSLLNDVPSMARFLADVDHPAVQANLNISHLALAHQPPAAVEALRGRVAHVPISDCDGKVHGDLPPGRGVVDFPPYLEAIKRLGIDDATISVELEYSPDPEHIVEWVVEAHDKTAALLRAAGLRP